MRRSLGSFCAYSIWSVTLPFDMKRSTKPSLFTSANSSCHAVDGRVSPPVNGWAAFTPRRRLSRRDAPKLLLTLGRQVVVLVVAHSKIDSAGPAPVAEEHGERAPARL